MHIDEKIDLNFTSLPANTFIKTHYLIIQEELLKREAQFWI